jgi:heterotetrameric sarcosine oxidase delta subunit
MLYIPCPYCGHRDETEFTYGGPSHITRPELTSTDREWTHYLYHRKNPKGPYRERWLHSFGCGQWFNVLRDTATHDILEVYLMGQSPPAQQGPTGQASATSHAIPSEQAPRTVQSASAREPGPTNESAP